VPASSHTAPLERSSDAARAGRSTSETVARARRALGRASAALLRAVLGLVAVGVVAPGVATAIGTSAPASTLFPATTFQRGASAELTASRGPSRDPVPTRATCRASVNNRAPQCLRLEDGAAASWAESRNDPRPWRNRFDSNRASDRSRALESESCAERPCSARLPRSSSTIAATSFSPVREPRAHEADLLQCPCRLWQHVGSPPVLRAPPLAV
jgi:hypothetical protein